MRINEALSQQILQLVAQINKGEISVGDILTGRVIAADNGLLLLRLTDGSIISARTVTDGQYSLGDILNLEVIEEKDGLILVRQDKNIIPGEMQKDTKENLSLILKSLGLPIDSKHSDILKAIRESDIEVRADAIKDAYKLISDKQVKDPGQAVFLAYNNMSHKQEYFPILRGILGKTLIFHEEWMSTIGNIDILDEETIIKIAEGFLVNDAIMDLDTTDSVNQIIKLYSDQGNAGTLDASIRSVVDNFIKNTLLESIIKTDRAGIQSVKYVQNQQAALGTSGNVSGSMETKGDFSFLDVETSFEDEIAFDAIMKQLLPKPVTEDKARQDEISGIIKNLLLKVKEKLPGTGLTIEMARRIINGSMSKLIKRDTVKSSEANLPKIDKWVRDTEGKLYIIKNALNKSTSPERERIEASVRELDTALKFFQDIISYEAYAQIPLVLKEHLTHGEIYIMKRRNKKGKLNPDDFSVFLSLTTVNLGTLGAFINVRNKNVMLRIMAEDERYFGLMQEEYKTLYDTLKEKGYNLYEIKCSLREEGINLINANKKASDLVYPQSKKIDMRI
ncbi:MAG: hypothetical protein GX045_09880 [Clostridiaceae bacterium]|nr:hypothetical protein [Clostridiaceae bacterium]